ncbi:hypothetical protein KSS87_016231 [Heliosperma pusillum]|nr:hypothetical protein KSS87_016231 [Heliosperma pusillum]
MVFPSVPLYLDPPNWQQHPNQQLQNPNNNQHDEQNQQQLIIPPQQIHQPQPHQQLGGPGPQQIRPSSMAEQARLLKIPPPAPLKCPRCESTNTKFCYFNNYSLLQPRHFCKTCRRYWTHNGALRNVPVGGGCRRNKRSSSKTSSGGGPSSSKPSLISSPSTMVRLTEHLRSQSRGGLNVNSLINIHSSGGDNGSSNGMSNFMTSLQNNMGLTFGGGPMYTPPPTNTNPREIAGLAGGGNDEFHPQQFPNFLGGFEIPGSYSSPFQNAHNHNTIISEDNGSHEHQRVNDSMSKSLSSRITSPEVKMEGNNAQQRVNLANQMMIMGIASSRGNNNDVSGNNNSNSNSNNQFNWNVNMENVAAGNNTSMWTDLSAGLNSSSTSHLL